MTFAQSSQSGMGFSVVAYFWKHFSQPGFSTRKKLRNHASSFIRLALWSFVFVASSAEGADVIPAARLADWRAGVTVGVQGGIPSNRTQYTNLVTAGADNTGSVDCKALLQSLINSCPSNKYIYVPDGFYRLETRVTPSSTARGWSIVGQSTNAVFFVKQSFLYIDNWAEPLTYEIVGTLLKGDTNITTLTAVDSSYVGHRVRISSQDQGRTNAHVFSSTFTDRNVNQWTEIKTITDGTNITVFPRIELETSADLKPWFHPDTSSTINENFGIENITITTTNHLTAETYDASSAVSVFGGRNWWARNCFVIIVKHAAGNSGFAFNMTRNLFAEIRDSTFVSFSSGSGTSVIYTGSDSGILIENNATWGGSPLAQLNNTSVSVVGYNYSTNAVSDDSNVGNPFDHHEPHSHHILWEGNYGTMFQNDAYHGSSSHITLYRNKLTGYDPIKAGLRRCVDIGRGGLEYNVVACDLGATNTTFWYTTTNQFYNNGAPWPEITGLHFRFGFPNAGSAGYGFNAAGGPYNAVKTPETHWLWPGTNVYVGTVTQSTMLTSNIFGNFASIPVGDIGQYILFQSGSDTNFYYNRNTNFPLLTINSNDSTQLYLNKKVWVTNGSFMYIASPGGWQQLDLDSTNTHFIEANWLSTNQAVTWSGSTNIAGLPDSYYRTSGWDWFTNASGGSMARPPFGVAAVGDAALTNRLPAQSLFHDIAAAAPTGTSAKTGNGRTKNKGPRGRFFQP